jgi:putative peptidoglycan lipid II flippase
MASDSSIPLPAPDPHLSHERIARSAGLAGAATLTSRVLGLVREQVLASAFGAGNEMDAFFVAFRIPNLVRDLFAEGAMSAAFVPTFTRHLTLRGKADAWRLGSNVMTALAVVTGALVILGAIFARPLVSAYAQNFASVPGKLDLTILLTRVVLPFLTLAALAAAAMGMLNSLQHYFGPALAPATFNVATIICVLYFTPLMPALGLPRIMIVAIAALIGGVAQLLVQWPALRREGFRYVPVLDLKDAGLRQVLLLMGPGTIGLAATQVNLFVTTLLATAQGTGAVSWLQYAFRVMYLPIGLFGVSIATAVLPTVARHAAVDNRQAVGRTVARGVALMFVVNVPATVGLIVLSHEIVQLLFERGRFLPADTLATAAALRCYALGLVGYSAARIVSPVFYALGRSRIAVLLSTTSIVVNLLLSLTLTRSMGFTGLALSTSLAAIFNGAVALVLLRHQLGGLEVSQLATTFVKTVAASAVMAMVVLWASSHMLTWLPGMHLFDQGSRLLVTIAAGLLALVATAKLLRVRELDEVFDEVKRRMPGGH